jgi:hypothetical protein
MPAAQIQQTFDEIFKKMEADQFGPERYALLFKPGKYKNTVNVGFYTQVAGLGSNPDDVQIEGGVNVPANWLPNANATCNFWRSVENLAITPNSTGGTGTFAVSQDTPLRRLHVHGDVQLFARSANGRPGWASGGFLADSLVDGTVDAGSQQQWLSRNSQWGGWRGANWNTVFLGCENAPASSFPSPPYTTIDETPVIREKPFLRLSRGGDFEVFVPALRFNSSGISWSHGPTRGTSIPLSKFYIARPETSTAADINAALAVGKDVLFTPGVYRLDDTLRVSRSDSVVMGLGKPSLVETNGKPIMAVSDVGGVQIAGLILDAGPTGSPEILHVGVPTSGHKRDHSANPTFLYDLTVRTGGAWPGRNEVGIRVDSNNVVLDQVWLWRADHGAGVGWTANPTSNGLVVNGDDVTCYGLFNEHHEGYQTLWNGNGGRVYMYQSEMPYDVPDQSVWMSGQTAGFASYKVSPSVTTHEAWGVGVYCFFFRAAVRANSAIEAPEVPGVRFHNMTTIWLSGRAGSEISHVINDRGGSVTSQANRRQTLK